MKKGTRRPVRSIHADKHNEVPIYSIWQARKDSNLQPMVLETTTLPIELRAYDRYALKGEGSGTMIIHHGAAVRKQEGGIS